MQCYDTDCFNTPQTPQQWHVLRARVKMLDIHVVSLLVGVILKDMGVYFGIDRTRQHNRGCWVLEQVVESARRGNINFLFLAWAVHVHLRHQPPPCWTLGHHGWNDVGATVGFQMVLYDGDPNITPMLSCRHTGYK